MRVKERIAKAFLAATLLGFSCSWVYAQEPVSFADLRLKAAVEDELWIWDPTPADMLGLTSLDAASTGITDLGGLEYAVNLQTLILRWNQISRISTLSSLVNLQYLDIHDNQISDLSALSGLSDLRTLVLRFNRIRDISPLAGLTSLEQLDLRGNPLDQEAYETYLPEIMANNPGIDLSYDAYSRCQLVISSTAGGSVIRPGEGQFVYDNGQTVYLQAKADEGHEFVRWSGSFSSSANPTFISMDADHSIRAIFSGSDDPNAPQAVYFADAALEEAVEEALSVADPTTDDMLELTVLACSDGGITSLIGLEYAANLEELDVANNAISDLSPLASLVWLQALDLRGNPLSQQAYSVHIPLIVANNAGIDLKYDPPDPYKVSIRSTAGGSVVSPGEGVFSYDKGHTVLLRAEADPGFVFVNWSGSYQSTANPASLAVYRDHNIEAVFAVAADTLRVDASAAGDPDEDGTGAHPFDTIQEAIDAAADGAAIVVAPDRYRETIDLRGKRLYLAGLAAGEAEMPIIDANGAGPVVSFTSGEDPNCTLVGFVITGGWSEDASAIVCAQSSPTIANCLIVGNRATGPDGAAVRCDDSQATFVNCTIADNLGAGIQLIDSHVTLVNSIVWGNLGGQGESDIALTGTSKPSVTYSNVGGGWPDVGNLDADPLFAWHGYWADPDDPAVAATPDDPDAVWVTGDYHLRSEAGRWEAQSQTWVQDSVTSPCIDAGDPAAPVGNEPAPNADIINLGAYGGTAEASKSALAP